MSTATDAPEVDALGFAPTRIVRVRLSRRAAVAHFFRVWMKPGDLTFPPQERRLIGAEHVDALVRWMRSPRPRRGAEVRLDAGTTPLRHGVSPKKDLRAPGEVGVSVGGQSPRGVSPFELPGEVFDAEPEGDTIKVPRLESGFDDTTPGGDGVCPENANDLQGVP